MNQLFSTKLLTKEAKMNRFMVFGSQNRHSTRSNRDRASQFKFLLGLQVVISAILKAIGPLVNIALLLLFAIIIFAIVGLEFYAGALNSTCYDITDLSKCNEACTRMFCYVL